MYKEKLKRIQALLLVISMVFTMSACGRKGKTNEDNETLVMFLQGKALIYSGDYNKSIIENYTGIGGNAFKYTEITQFSSGVEAVSVQSKEDAVELATAIVGENNIIYIDYKDKDMVLTYKK